MVIISENYEGGPKKTQTFCENGFDGGLSLPVKQPTGKTAIQKVRFFWDTLYICIRLSTPEENPG